MARTRHIHQRMSQRSINSHLVDLASRFGTDSGDKVVLDRKNTTALLKAMDAMRKDLLAVHAKGGIVVVEQNGVQITTYALNSYARSKVGGPHATH
ncbi:hypothetical protein [Vreelandella profundi]|uniref:hypothetical protein n=1 Tax=Vreelandella profundi TaxID=2852117 RepID=UPI001F34CA89|nr:hypothetical protein [Halomonas profundi]